MLLLHFTLYHENYSHNSHFFISICFFASFAIASSAAYFVF
nr:MAG TPA: hypothetical protein [Caudoviricetes sp.]